MFYTNREDELILAIDIFKTLHGLPGSRDVGRIVLRESFCCRK